MHTHTGTNDEYDAPAYSAPTSPTLVIIALLEIHWSTVTVFFGFVCCDTSSVARRHVQLFGRPRTLACVAISVRDGLRVGQNVQRACTQDNVIITHTGSYTIRIVFGSVCNWIHVQI